MQKVDVDILNKANTGLLQIFTPLPYQMQPGSEGFIARTLKAYLHNENNVKRLSVIHLHLPSTSQKKEPKREVSNSFTISTPIKRSTNVYLVLEEKVDKSDNGFR